jgi:sporulation protein YlmC with PRC-barrel domain
MRFPALALSVLLASGAALAQQTTPPPATGTAASSAARSTSTVLPGQMRADDIIGTRVYGPNDTNVGSVDDIIFNTASKQIETAILSVGGFLGIGNKLVSVPIDQLQMGQDGRLTIGLTHEQLERAPEFEYGAARSGSGATGTTGTGTMGIIPPSGGTTRTP